MMSSAYEPKSYESTKLLTNRKESLLSNQELVSKRYLNEKIVENVFMK